MRLLTEAEKKERGWYYVGRDKFFWRNCNSCGIEYQGMGSTFCSRTCSANMKLIEHDDGTITVAVKNRSTGHNYGPQISKAKKGRPNINLRGEKHFNWKGGDSNRKRYEREKLMCMAEYKEWRLSVFIRDSYKCVVCGVGGKLQVHHIYNWADYPELRYEVSNGVTVCSKHHPRGRKKEGDMVEFFNRVVANNQNVVEF